MNVDDLIARWLTYKAHLIMTHNQELEAWFKERKELADMSSIYTPAMPVRRKPTFEGFMDYIASDVMPEGIES